MAKENITVDQIQQTLSGHIKSLDSALNDTLDKLPNNFDVVVESISNIITNIDETFNKIAENNDRLAKLIQNDPQIMAKLQQDLNQLNYLQEKISSKLAEQRTQLKSMPTSDEKYNLSDQIQQLIQLKYQITNQKNEIVSLQQGLKTEQEVLASIKSVEKNDNLNVSEKAKELDKIIGGIRPGQLTKAELAEHKKLNIQYTRQMANTIANTSQALFKAIPESEFLEPGKAPAVGSARANFTAFSDQLSQFVSRSIFETSTISERTQAIERAAQLALQLKARGDLYSYMTIHAAINNSAILKITISKEGLSKEARALIETRPGGTFRAELYKIYNKRVKAGLPAVPPLPSYLGDLVAVSELQEANPDKNKQKLLDSKIAVRMIGELTKGQVINTPITATAIDTDLQRELLTPISANPKLLNDKERTELLSKVDAKYNSLMKEKIRVITEKVMANKDLTGDEKSALIAKKKAEYEANVAAEKKMVLDNLITDYVINDKSTPLATALENPDKLDREKFTNPLRGTDIIQRLAATKFLDNKLNKDAKPVPQKPIGNAPLPPPNFGPPPPPPVNSTTTPEQLVTNQSNNTSARLDKNDINTVDGLIKYTILGNAYKYAEQKPLATAVATVKNQISAIFNQVLEIARPKQGPAPTKNQAITYASQQNENKNNPEIQKEDRFRSIVFLVDASLKEGSKGFSAAVSTIAKLAVDEVQKAGAKVVTILNGNEEAKNAVEIAARARGYGCTTPNPESNDKPSFMPTAKEEINTIIKRP